MISAATHNGYSISMLDNILKTRKKVKQLNATIFSDLDKQEKRREAV